MHGAIDAGAKIVYLDQVFFTRTVNQTRDFCARFNSHFVDQNKIMDSYLGVCAAISLDKGVEHLYFTDQSFDSEVYIEFLRELRKKIRTKKLVLFLDRASYHTSQETRDVYNELGIKYVLNAGYSPTGNPIEAVFSAVKQYYMKAKLNNVLNETEYDKEELIRESFAKIGLQSIRNCIKRSLDFHNV